MDEVADHGVGLDLSSLRFAEAWEERVLPPFDQQGLETGNVILDVGGKPVASAGDVRNAIAEAKSQGKHGVLMRVKTANATMFVAVPLANG